MIKKQFLRFITVGLICTVISYISFFVALRFFSINYLISSCLSFMAGVFVGFFLNKNWTFTSGEVQTKKIIIHYFTVYIISLGINLLFLRITVGGFGMMPELAYFLAIGITTCTNFIGTKFFVFKK